MLKIRTIARKLGSITETNKDIEQLVGWEADEIFEKTGIKNRYISDQNENSLSLAIDAVNKLDDKELHGCDLIVSVTNTPYYDFPNISNFIHSHFKLSKNVNCLGLNAGCTGFVDALELVNSYFKSSLSKKALIINTDTYTKFLNNKRSTRTLFSDGATATIIQNDESGFNISKIRFSSALNSQDSLYKKADCDEGINMDGPKVMQFAIGTVLKDVLELAPNEECVFFPHQAGKLVLGIFSKKLPSTVEMIANYENYGNLVSASIPNLIFENMEKLEHKNVLISGFGVGLSHKGILLNKV
tara:strand:- start:4 stop:903 length:900 start_codon:yes stop_codon:yes gene_type:complete